MAKMRATTHAGLDRIIGDRRRAVTIGNNTTAERGGAVIVVRLHGHPIVTLHPSGGVELSDCGWWTVTTRDRLNSFTPHPRAGVFQHRNRRYLRTADGIQHEWTGTALLDSSGHLADQLEEVAS
jgi:hypothetical protein